MISKAWATIRRARSFLPLLRPFIMRLAEDEDNKHNYLRGMVSIPVNQSFDNRHLSLLKLLFGVTAGGVGEVDGMMDLDVVVERDIFYFDPKTKVEAFCHESRESAGRTHESPTFRRA